MNLLFVGVCMRRGDALIFEISTGNTLLSRDIHIGRKTVRFSATLTVLINLLLE